MIFRRKMMIRKSALIIPALMMIAALSAQEVLKSAEEEYYDYLSLTGVTERPALGYRTLSDSTWLFGDVTSFEENDDGTFTRTSVPGAESARHIWRDNNLGSRYVLWESGSPSENWFVRGLNQNITLRIYGPDWFNSINTAAPYGQNDGALWQGKGYNTSLSAGARLEAYGFELTLRPQLSFSQNLAFVYIQPNYAGIDKNGNQTKFFGAAAEYGYYGVTSIDAPQRFGDKSFFKFDWGDTEIRWTWHSLTLGFGTQSPWLGPAWLNPIIHSNNAASYPKADIGIRKTSIVFPKSGLYLGDIEARAWWGRLSESDFFDNDHSNDSNLIAGFSIYYQLPFLKEFTIGMNRTMLSKWSDKSAYTLLGITIPGISYLTSGGNDESDQRFSISFDYLNKTIGWEVYFEWARNDFSPNLDYIFRYPFHTQGWTFGTKKDVRLPWGWHGEIILEITGLECSADYDRLIGWYSTFYAHHIISQGYTNEGQWLGAGIGTGGNSQYLGFKMYHPRGNITIFMQRRNPDLDYTMFIDSRNRAEDFNNGLWTAEKSIRAIFDVGITATHFILPDHLMAKGAFVFEDEHNPLNFSDSRTSTHRINFHIELGAKYIF